MDCKEANDSNLNLLTALIYGEARGEPLLGKYAVAWVVRHRVEDPRWSDNYRDVIFQPKQFSCLDDHNREKFDNAFLPSRNSGNIYWRECRNAAYGVLFGWCRDMTLGANHYFANWIDTPSWAQGHKPTIEIGRHRFYKL